MSIKSWVEHNLAIYEQLGLFVDFMMQVKVGTILSCKYGWCSFDVLEADGLYTRDPEPLEEKLSFSIVRDGTTIDFTMDSGRWESKGEVIFPILEDIVKALVDHGADSSDCNFVLVTRVFNAMNCSSAYLKANGDHGKVGGENVTLFLCRELVWDEKKNTFSVGSIPKLVEIPYGR